MFEKTKKKMDRKYIQQNDGWIEIKNSFDELEYYGLIANCD